MGALKHMTNEQIVNEQLVNAEEVAALEAEADAFDAGEWPRATVTRVGRPQVTGEPTAPLTFRLGLSKIDLVNAKAARKGMSRGAALREAVEQWLALA